MYRAYSLDAAADHSISPIVPSLLPPSSRPLQVSHRPWNLVFRGSQGKRGACREAMEIRGPGWRADDMLDEGRGIVSPTCSRSRKPARTVLVATCAALGGCYASSGAESGDSSAGEDAVGVDHEVRDIADGGDAHDEGSRDARVDTTQMVFVPSGAVLIGSDDTACAGDEPMHEVWLDAYWIDTYEVTNGEYESCVRAGVCVPPEVTYSRTHVSYYGTEDFRDYPFVSVGVGDEAELFCEWEGKRLPTDAEWEKAARGGCELRGDHETCDVPADAPPWPWGAASPSCERANIGTACFADDVAPPGSFGSDVSPYGAFDMAGNTSEVVADWYDPAYYTYGPNTDPTGPTADQAAGRCPGWPSTGSPPCHVLRGLSFAETTPPRGPVSCRFGNTDGRFWAGLRCAADP
jgi:formylglycine-generating enzyme required for sulfatase activity